MRKKLSPDYAIDDLKVVTIYNLNRKMVQIFFIFTSYIDYIVHIDYNVDLVSVLYN